MENCCTPELSLELVVREGSRFVFPNGCQYIKTIPINVQVCVEAMETVNGISYLIWYFIQFV